MSAAHAVLERLLRKAERARTRGDAAAVSLPMTSATAAREYLALQGLDEHEHFHAEIAVAEREGAVVAMRDRLRGDGVHLKRLTVRDAGALARLLGMALLDDRIDVARESLLSYRQQHPVIDAVLDAWRRGRTVRGCGPEAADDLAAAARVIAARRDDPQRERILRRESVRLFDDSKRLERLTPWLELLLTGETAATGMERADVWASLGLRREPQPLLISGRGRIELDDGTRLDLPRRYLGLPVEALRAIETSATHLITVENLASFHDAATAPGHDTCLLVYTGGMPSPAWRAAYACILRGLPATTPVLHWGDIDAGGFRIAAAIAEIAQAMGHRLRPWRMWADALPPGIRGGTPTASTLTDMQRWARRAGWDDVADALGRHPLVLEQESLDPGFDDLPVL